ncbi:thimet oligopeptidase-like [Centruroides sculpturatus]|uniref:thimet oligopeptidase-like n=1 Tax=Centruroides sculpturatus TaxID=218467 RepID=UPI000C6CE264|nr:thimet oligopeptidase-like [Centruroides sculpturatus]
MITVLRLCRNNFNFLSNICKKSKRFTCVNSHWKFNPESSVYLFSFRSCHLSRINMTPQGIKFCYDLKLSAEELLKRTDDLIDRLRKTYDKVGALSNDQVSCKTVLEPLNYAEAEKQTEGALYELPKHVSTDKALRDAGSEADRKLREFHIEIGMRQDIFNKLLLLEAKNETLDSEYSRYLQKLIKLGKRNGLHLSPTVQAKIKSLKTEISNYCVEFIKNVNEENTILEFSEEELDGLPADFIENLTKSETGKRKVTLKYPHYFSIMGKAKNPETRKKLEYAFNSRCIDENSTILEKLAELRHETALLLGFPNHVAFITDLRMAKTAKTVYNFLTTLASKLEPLWKEERKFIMELKNKECNKLDIPFEDKLHPSELRYYNNLVEEIKYSVDQNKLREYFPLPTVTKGLLNIYQELLGLEFAEIKNPVAWHPDVQLQGCLLPDGDRQVPIAVIIANLTKPTDEKPSLLDHNEVKTFFHEFGHVMHEICTTANLAFFSGANVEWDFVEAPSQMLENWCWEPETLRRMSGHYKDGSPLPDNILQSLVHSRLANVGYFNLRQIALSMLDYNIHTNPKADTRQIYHDLSCSLLGIPPTEGTNFAANFGHLVDGYDAGYYSYLWSEVYSMDMFFSRFKSEGIMNYQTGKDYRNKILAPGGTKDGFDMLRDFLGREPNDEAFLKSKGLKV